MPTYTPAAPWGGPYPVAVVDNFGNEWEAYGPNQIKKPTVQITTPDDCCLYTTEVNVSYVGFDPSAFTPPGKSVGDTYLVCHPDGLSMWVCDGAAWIPEWIKPSATPVELVNGAGDILINDQGVNASAFCVQEPLLGCDGNPIAKDTRVVREADYGNMHLFALGPRSLSGTATSASQDQCVFTMRDKANNILFRGLNRNESQSFRRSSFFAGPQFDEAQLDALATANAPGDEIPIFDFCCSVTNESECRNAICSMDIRMFNPEGLLGPGNQWRLHFKNDGGIPNLQGPELTYDNFDGLIPEPETDEQLLYWQRYPAGNENTVFTLAPGETKEVCWTVSIVFQQYQFYQANLIQLARVWCHTHCTLE